MLNGLMQAECTNSNLLSYCTGWLLVLGWQTTVAGCGVIIGNLIKYCIVLYHPENAAVGSQWFPTLLAVLSLLLGGIFNLYCECKLSRDWTKRLTLSSHQKVPASGRHHALDPLGCVARHRRDPVGNISARPSLGSALHLHQWRRLAISRSCNPRRHSNCMERICWLR
jgi:hypothetical protein